MSVARPTGRPRRLTPPAGGSVNRDGSGQPWTDLVSHGCRNVTDEGLMELARHDQQLELSLADPRQTDAGLEELAPFTDGGPT